MALKPLLSFSTGELDPVLHDNVTLEKFNKGLDTARNVIVSKTGTLMSRFATHHVVKSKNDDEKIKILALPNYSSGVVKFLEWGVGYVRAYTLTFNFYSLTKNLDATVVTSYTEDDLENMHFAIEGDYVYTFVGGKAVTKFDYENLAFESNFFDLEETGNFLSGCTFTVTSSGTVYNVDYAIALVVNGEEYIIWDLTSTGPFAVPAAAGDKVLLSITVDNTDFVEADIPLLTEIKVYRRPTEGYGFGYIGSTNNFSWNGTNIICSFVDLGAAADFTNGPISNITKSGMDGVDVDTLNPNTGVIYQQRLLMTPINYKEAIIASRPGYPDNFYRDFPYDADSALAFKSGSSGNAKILRMIDNDGLIVFTSIGPYVNLGVLSPTNLVLVKKGSWVINELVPPLSVPGGVFFVDKATNAIMQFVYSDEIGTYQGLEHSIFSNHLFESKKVTSWGFQSGINPLIIITLHDGTFVTFTYSHEHQMRAWTRHDSKYPIEQVEGTGLPDTSLFVVNQDGNRYISVSLPRKTVIESAYPEYYYNEVDKIAANYLIDSCVATYNIMNPNGAGTAEFTLTPVVADDWDGELTLTSTSGLLTAAGSGSVGTILRFFDENDRSVVDLEVTAYTSDNEVTVQPSCTFPSDQSTGFNLYNTQVTVTGLDHLEGEDVAVVVDGAVVASPNNDEEEFTTYTVSSGEITLSEDHRGANIIVGRSITADIKTLNISTVEQKPTLIESLTTNKLYVKIKDTRGLFISDKFPEELEGEVDGSTVLGMEDMEKYYVPDGYDFTGNRYKQPVSRRIEQTIPGNWKSNGKVAIRQVDPLHFEIQSIIPDVEVLWRSDR